LPTGRPREAETVNAFEKNWMINEMNRIERSANGNPSRLCTALLALCAVGAPRGAHGQQQPEASNDSLTTLSDLIDSTLPEFALFGGVQLNEPLEIGARLRWDNNSRGSESGLTAVYVRDGMPEAVVCVYPWSGQLVHDFSSLSRGRIVGRRENQSFWETDRPGVEFRRVPGAAAPAQSRAARLLQMKELARARFEGILVGWKPDDSDRQELRLLPRPLYRYEASTAGAVDGAVFAYATGVDPELLLLLEAVSGGAGAHWEYAFVRRTSGELQGRLDQTVVWNAARFPRTDDPRGLDRGVTRPLPEHLLAPAQPAAN
jgi:hypothetical protein